MSDKIALVILCHSFTGLSFQSCNDDLARQEQDGSDAESPLASGVVALTRAINLIQESPDLMRCMPLVGLVTVVLANFPMLRVMFFAGVLNALVTRVDSPVLC